MVFNFGYFVGYSETQCINSTLQLFKVLMAKEIFLMSSFLLIELLKIFLLIFFSKGKLFISPEGILIILIFNFFLIFFKLLKLKTEKKIFTLFLFPYLINFFHLFTENSKDLNLFKNMIIFYFFVFIVSINKFVSIK